MRRISILVMLMALAGSAGAEPPFLETFNRTYPNLDNPLKDASCGTCHAAAGPPARNPYGAAVGGAMTGRAVTPDVLKGLEGLDSDGDGFTNRQEIAAGTLPGDPASKPAGTPAAKPASPPPAPTGVEREDEAGEEAEDGSSTTPSGGDSPNPLVPRHSFHPTVVHFPIALFLFGTFLEALALFRNRPELRKAADWNLAFGAISGWAAVALGLVAAVRLGYGITLEGGVGRHLLVGLSAAVFMSLSVVVRARAQDPKRAFLMLVIAAVLVGIAGHLGGLLVHA